MFQITSRTYNQLSSSPKSTYEPNFMKATNNGFSYAAYMSEQLPC